MKTDSTEIIVQYNIFLEFWLRMESPISWGRQKNTVLRIMDGMSLIHIVTKVTLIFYIIVKIGDIPNI